jgi:hypothetical protein
METRETDETWPSSEIGEAQTQLYNYLSDFKPEKYVYSKHAIMGPAGKLLGIISASNFGDNVEAYIGYITNIHDQQSKNRLTQLGMSNLKNAVTTILKIRETVSERAFLKILRSIDYAVYYLKMKEISERIAERNAEDGNNK